MSLIKRSVVLYKDNTKGVLTVIRLGETIGAKLVLNEPEKEVLWLGLKPGEGKQQHYKITRQITEFKPDCDLGLNDIIGAVVLYQNGSVYAYGGMREKVSVALIKAAIAEGAKPETPPPVETIIEVPETIDVTTDAAETPSEPQAAEAFAVVEPTEITEQQEAHPSHAMPPQAEPIIAPTILPSATLPQEAEDEPEEEAIVARPVHAKPPQESPVAEPPKPAESAKEPPTEDDKEKKRNNPFDIPKAKNFYQAVRGRLEEIMTINPKESELESLIPDSEWVKVRYNGEEYYVVGRLYENNVVTYIGYGVPGIENVRPPKEAEDLCDFLPLPEKNGVGYWLMFQKADDGTISRDL